MPEKRSLVTLFSAPKAFTDPDTARSQWNAIQSWKRLEDVEVVLMGNDRGIAAAAEDMEVRHLPDVALNPNGVPLISSMIQQARLHGDSPLLSIINADIILTSDFTRAARDVLMSLRGGQALPDRRSNLNPGSEGDLVFAPAKVRNCFVLVSRRWDLEVRDLLDFGPGWEDRLRRAVQDEGRLHRPTGSDFFVFPRECYTDVPDFSVGRAGWDNWMIYQARKQGWAVIDGTPSMLVVHQAHDYRHLPGAQPHYNHPDTLVNMRLAGGQAAIRYTILDATHELVGGRLARPASSRDRTLRGIELLLRRLLFFLPEGMVENIARPRRWGKRLKRLLGTAESDR